MSTWTRGRRHHGERVEEWGSESDEEGSYYETLQAPPSSSKKRSVSKVRVHYEHESAPSVSRKERQRVYHHASYGPSSQAEPEVINVSNHLYVPAERRPRASSTGAPPQPTYLQPVFLDQQRGVSKERVKHRRHGSDYSSEDSDRSRHRRHRRKSSPKTDLPADVATRLAKLELLEEQQRREEYALRRPSSRHEENVPPDVAKRLARLELLEEQQRLEERQRDKKEKYPSEVADRLARLKALEEKNAQKEEEAAIVARFEERRRRDKQREEQIAMEYKEKQRQAELEEQEAFRRAEQKRRDQEAKAVTERERFLAQEKERVAKEKAEQARLIAEAKAKQEKEEKEAEEERQRIILEEEARRKKEKDKHEALRKQILAEEDERKKKEKQKEKEEEEEFNAKVKEKFMKAGYSPDYIEDILEEKKKALVRRSSKRSENVLAVEAARPTYIRVQLRYLYPETLDAYGLPWEYDPSDSNYLFIKEYITHELQQELFEHTKKIRIRREKLLLTDTYSKETTTVLKPAGVVKESDNLYVVRRKSERSRSRGPGKRGSWMFT